MFAFSSLRAISRCLFAFAVAVQVAFAPSSFAAVVPGVKINEVDLYPGPGSYNVAGPNEFVELSGPAGALLDGYVLAFLRPGTTITRVLTDDIAYRVIKLDGYQLDSNGLFVVGTRSVPGVDLVAWGEVVPTVTSGIVVPQAGLPGNDTASVKQESPGLIRDAYGAIALFEVPSGVTIASSDNLQKIKNSYTSGVKLVDSLIVYRVGRVDAYFDKELGPTHPLKYARANEHLSSLSHYQSVGRFTDGTIAQLQPTPAGINDKKMPFRLRSQDPKKVPNWDNYMLGVYDYGVNGISGVDPRYMPVIREGETGKVRVRFLTRLGGSVRPPHNIQVSIYNPDFTEVECQSNVTIPVQAITKTLDPVIEVKAKSDGVKDGNQITFLVFSSPDIAPRYVPIKTVDVDTVTPSLVITEVNGRQEAGDANGDGTANAADQFVEIVNRKDASQDLAGKKLFVDGVDTYTFPSGAVLNPGCAVVLFANGVSEGIGQNPTANGIVDRFGCALVLNAQKSNGLGINPTHSVVELRDGNGQSQICDFIFQPYGMDANSSYGPGSAVRGGTGNAPLGSDSSIPPFPQNHQLVGGKRFSPGARQDGSVWSTTGNELVITFSTSTIAEAGEKGQSTMRVARKGPTIGPLSLNLVSLNTAQAELQSITATIQNGQSWVEVLVDPVRNSVSSNTAVTFTAVDVLGCYKNGTSFWDGQLTVVDLSSLTLALTATSVVESAAPGLCVLTVSRAASTSSQSFELRVRQGPSSNNTKPPYTLVPGQITVTQGAGCTLTPTADPSVYTLTLPVGSATGQIAIEPVNDMVAEVLTELEIAVVGAPSVGSLNGVADLQIVDNGGVKQSPLISEVEAVSSDVGGTEKEFVEIKSPVAYSGAKFNLSAYVVVFYDKDGKAYRVEDLSGSNANASGFFVLGDPLALNAAGPGGGDGYRLVTGFELDDQAAAVALYKNPEPGTILDVPLTAGLTPAASIKRRNNLLDAVVYGATAPQALIDSLIPGTGTGIRYVAVPTDPGQSISRKAGDYLFRDPSSYVNDRNASPLVENAEIEVSEVFLRSDGDANDNNSASAADQFIEIVNRSQSQVNLAGRKLQVKDSGNEYTFPSGAILNPGCAAVVFANGVTEGIGQNPNLFGCALVLNAGFSEGFALDPSFGVVEVTGPGVETVGAFVYKPVPAPVTPVYSPGSKEDNTPWSTTGNELEIAFSADTIAEAGEKGQSTMRVTRKGPIIGPLSLNLASLNTAQAELQSITATIQNGQSWVEVLVDPVRNGVNSSTAVTFTAVDVPGCYKNGTSFWGGQLTVVDISSLTLALTATSVVESAAPGLCVLSVSRAASTSSQSFELKVRQGPSSNNMKPPYTLVPGQITLVQGVGCTLAPTADPSVYTLTLPVGSSTGQIAIEPVNDMVLESLTQLEIAVVGEPNVGSLNGVADLQIVDNGGLLSGPVINELESDSQDANDEYEYVELKGPETQSGPNFSLSSYVIVFYDQTGKAYQVTPLEGAVADTQGFFIVADPKVRNATVAGSGDGYKLLVPLDIDNGPAAVALYKNPIPGTPLDFPADAPFDSPSASIKRRNNLLDAVVYGDTAPILLLSDLTPGKAHIVPPASNSPRVVARISDGGAFRDPAAFNVSQVPTPAYSNTGLQSSALAYLALFGATGVDGDEDFDELTNLMEYVFGMSPVDGYVTVPNGPRLPEISSTGKTITIFLGSTAALDPRVKVTAEVSLDATTWSELQSFTGGSLGSSVNATYSGPATQVFLRSKVDLVPPAP